MDRLPGEGLTVDQLRVLLTISEEGSFSAAGRRLRRTQGAISYHVAALEAQLGLELFDRSKRRPRLTAAGSAIVQRARQVLGELDELRAVAQGIGGGLEPWLGVAVDVLFPPRRLAALAVEFQEAMPTVDLVLRAGVLGAVSEIVASGESQIGITGLAPSGAAWVAEACGSVELVAVAAAAHPLAALAEVDELDLSRCVHIVLAGDAHWAGPETMGVDGGRKWRVSDLDTRLELLRAGLGWARMPRERVTADLEGGALVELAVGRWRSQPVRVPLLAIHRRDRPPGPAGRWLLERLTTPT
jgi:DNA-binding transcriptional LysR family regulator